MSNSLNNIGFGGVLSFDDSAATSGMKRASSMADQLASQFGKLSGTMGKIGKGIGKVAGSIGPMGVAMLPVTAGLTLGAKEAMGFEHQMSAVRAVSDASPEEFQAMTAQVKEFGLSTGYSATEAGKGLEILQLSGYTAESAMQALGPVMNAAAADGIEMGEAAEFISATMNGLGLAIDGVNATRTADVLALISAKTATDMRSLGEAMKYAAPQAKTMGIDLETTTAALGAMADAGLKGSIGGTSFTQALVKLAGPSKEGAELMNKMGITMSKTADGGLDMVDVIRQISAKTQGITDVVKRADIVTEIFGVRGQKAFTAIETALQKTADPGTGFANKMEQLVAQAKNAEGAAERMAKIRLDNFQGAVQIATNTLKGFAVETMGQFLPVLKEGIQQYQGGLAKVTKVLQELNSEQGLTDKTAQEAGQTWTSVAMGIKEGIDTVIAKWRELRQSIFDSIAEFTGEQSGHMITQFSKWITILTLVAGAVAPILTALGGVVWFVNSVFVPVFSLAGTVISAAFWPVTITLAALAAGFYIFRRDGESVGETFSRLGETIMSGFGWVLDTIVKPFISGFAYTAVVFDFVWEKIQDFCMSVSNDFSDVFGGIIQSLKELGPFFKVVFTFIGNIVGVVADAIGLAFVSVIDWIKDAIHNMRNIVLSVMESIVNFIKNVAYGIGWMADLIGLEFGKAMMEFGKDEFHIQVGTGQRGLGGDVGLPSDKEMKELEAASKGETAGIMSDFDKETFAAMHDAEAYNQDAQNELAGMVVGALPDTINVESKVCVDGKTVAKATAQHKQEIHERAGFKTTPWQRRAMLEHGAAQGV